MFPSRYVLFLIIFFTSCKSVQYTQVSASLYHEFGGKSDYYSNITDSFSLELYHGSTYTDFTHKLSLNSLPKPLRNRISIKDWKTVFLMENFLHPSIMAVQKTKENLNANTIFSKNYANRHLKDLKIDTFNQTITYYLKAKNADTIFCAEKLMAKDRKQFKIVSFSYNHQWLKGIIDKPSYAICEMDINTINSAWTSSDLVKNAFTSKDNLLQLSSRNFWLSKNNYLFPLEILKHNPQPESKDSNGYFEASTTFNSFVGNYKKAILERDRISNKPTNLEKIAHGVGIANAERAIYDSARNHSIIIVNEAHTQPRNRRFFATILDSLFVLGYKHIFVETLEKSDSEINERGFPIQVSGYYTSEPNFGNALRKALTIGYVLHSYDNLSSGRQREIAQAQVISDFIKNNKSEKIIIYCGHGHLNEDPTDSMMGYFLKTITKIDPFTIEQTRMLEKGDSNFESQLYKTTLQKYDFSVPQILKDENEMWVPENAKHKYDMLIVFPRSEYDSDGNPDWMFHLGPMPYTFTFKGAEYKDCLFQIYNSNETKKYPYWDLIPITNLILGKKNELVYYLNKGEYSIYVTNLKRDIIYQKRIIL